jgi:hypothetical protein
VPIVASGGGSGLPPPTAPVRLFICMSDLHLYCTNLDTLIAKTISGYILVRIIIRISVVQKKSCNSLVYKLFFYLFFSLFQKKEEEEEEGARPTAQSAFKVRLIKYDETKKVPVIKQVKDVVENINLVQVRTIFHLYILFTSARFV